MTYAPLQDLLQGYQQGLFITGTDTNVGKTVVAACLVRALAADYWKPVQSGLVISDDTTTVIRLAGVSADRVHPSVYRLQAPLSPHEAARREGIRIALDRFRLPRSARPVVVEGAGGVLAPLNDCYLMIDLIARLGLPVVLVVRSSLGTINHSLLSLAALRGRGLWVLGIIMNGPPDQTNRVALEKYSRIPVKELPQVDQLDTTAVVTLACTLSEGRGWTDHW